MKRRIRRGDPQKQSYWEEVVQRWRAGGQSVRAFCRGAGLRESAFYFWRRRVACRSHRADAVNGPRSQPHAVTPASHLSQRVSPEGSSSPSFLPMHVVAAKSLKPASGHGLAEAAQGVEIILGAGRPLSGHWFVFRSRRGDRIKLLWWDRDGLTLYYRRLEEGTFRFPTSGDADARSIEVSAQELSLVLWGIDPASVKRQKGYQRELTAGGKKLAMAANLFRPGGV